MRSVRGGMRASGSRGGARALAVVGASLVALLAGAPGDAHAATVFTAVQNGSWSDPATWGGAIPGPADTKVVPAAISILGGTATNSGTIENYGKIGDATIDNSGAFDNYGFIGGSTITSSGTISNPGGIGATVISNSGTINNGLLPDGTVASSGYLDSDEFSTLENSGYIYNYGTFRAEGPIDNSGHIYNALELSNSSTITNTRTGFIQNQGGMGASLDNSGTIDNYGPGVYDGVSYGGILNYDGGAINNSGTINDNCGAKMDNYAGGTFTGSPVNEVLCIPEVVAPADSSTVQDPKPVLQWDANGEIRTVTYSVSLEDASSPGTPIELATLSSLSAGPVDDLLAGEEYEWSVTATLDPSYDPGYPYTSTPAGSVQQTFTVKLPDTTPPVLAPHAEVTAEATSAQGAAVSYTLPAATDNVDPQPTVACSPGSGSEFALGDTTVTCTAIDASQNSSSETFVVHVVDTTAPVVTVPASIAGDQDTPAGAVVSFAASATDVVDGVVPVACVPASGSVFAPGATTVTCSATDARGNTGHATFAVTVRSAADQLGDLVGQVSGVGPGKSLVRKAKRAQSELEAGHRVRAALILAVFEHEVRAQSGKSIDAATAAQLVAAAERIRAALGR